LVPTHLGSYKLERKLGQGGMGIVFAATHTLMKRKAALKIIKPAHGNNEMLVRRFRREIAILAQVPDHPNLVRAQYAGEENGLLYLAMDYVDGVDLNLLLSKLGPLPAHTACSLIGQAAEGLAAIHRAGLVHRDLKPSNLMLSSDGVVKILDLGLARLMEGEELAELTPAHCHLGTADYQAPEQASDAHNVDIRADIYSLGCTLYKLLTGKAPFADSPSPLAKLRRHASGMFPRLREETPGELSTILGKMVAARVEERFRTPGELAAALRRLAGDTDLSACYQSANAADLAQADCDAPTASGIGPHTDIATKNVPSAATRKHKLNRGALFAAVCLALAAGGGFAAYLWLPRDRAPDPIPNVEPAPPLAVKPADKIEPAVRRPFLLDDLAELQWHDLLDQEPLEVLLNKADGAALVRFDPKLRQFSVTSPRNAVFLLGETMRPSFTYQVGITQIGWSSGAGIVLGYQPDDLKGKELWPGQFQFFVMHTRPDEKGILRYQITRGKGKIKAVGERINVSTFNVMTEDIVNPLGEQVIEVVVRGHRVREVRINGVPLHTLTTHDVEREFQPTDCMGGVGTLNIVNSCTYRKANLKIHSARN